ncbi:MAG: hypothetical protein F9K38_15775 [Pseudorhodoplanes sp.]|nr:MAG: hypothetical protein F9K38_15775 [Pseudorhodoplanes sp.]
MLHMPAALPLDLSTAMHERQYRDSLHWPLEHATARDFHLGVNERFLQVMAAETDQFWRDVLVLAAPLVWMDALSRLEYALIAQGLEDRGQSCIGGPAYMSELTGRRDDARHAGTQPRMKSDRAVGRALLRRVVRTASWTPWYRLPRALLAPQIVAVSHHTFLRAEARNGGVIAFHHAPNLIDALPQASLTPADREQIAELSRTVAVPFLEHAVLKEPFRGRLASVCAAVIAEHLSTAAIWMRRLRQARKMPRHVWAGTGGYRPVRAIRLEVRRRGGTATGFDHGGSTAMVDEPFGLAVLEQSVSDEFRVYTKDAAALVSPRGAELARPFANVAVTGGEGDPAFAVPLQKPRASSGDRRVLYVSGPFLGPRQRMRPAINDVMKFDWQFRLAAQLNALPIELLCQPHPEGALAGQTHPLSEVAPVSGKKFEEVFAWADVIVTDVVLSTTLWKAACSSKPIVLIDLDMCNLNPRLSSVLSGRLRIVRARYDERNRPVVADDELKDAVLGVPLTADPSAFRLLLAGVHA